MSDQRKTLTLVFGRFQRCLISFLFILERFIFLVLVLFVFLWCLSYKHPSLSPCNYRYKTDLQWLQLSTLSTRHHSNLLYHETYSQRSMTADEWKVVLNHDWDVCLYILVITEYLYAGLRSFPSISS